MYRKAALLAAAALIAAALMTGCQSAAGSYREERQTLDELARRVEALERENADLKTQLDELAGTAERQREELETQRRTIGEQQGELERQRELLGDIETLRQWIRDVGEQAGEATGALREEVSGWVEYIRYKVDAARVTGKGAEERLGLLMAVAAENGKTVVTFDPVEWDADATDGEWIVNETVADAITLPVAEDTFYGAGPEGQPLSITYAQLKQKAGADPPVPFMFYILDNEVYLITEQYVP